MDYHQFINFIAMVLYIAILARVLVSWIAPGRMDNPLVALIYHVTEPILAPIRRILPRTAMLDLSPMVAMILISIILAIVSAV